MSDKKVVHPVRGFFHVIKSLFFFCCVVIAGFAVVGYAAGWVKFSKTDDKATMEVETTEIKEAADKAVEKGKELLGQASDKVKDVGKDTDDKAEEKDAEGTDANKGSNDVGDPVSTGTAEGEPQDSEDGLVQ